jgi:hypothetical protein
MMLVLFVVQSRRVPGVPKLCQLLACRMIACTADRIALRIANVIECFSPILLMEKWLGMKSEWHLVCRTPF